MDNNNTLTKLKAQIEEIEKRIKAISLQVTTSSQISAIKLCLDELKNLLDQYQAEYETLITDYDSHKTDYEELLAEYNEHKQNYETFYNDYTQHKQDFHILSTSFNGLSQSNMLEHSTMQDGISLAFSKISDLTQEQTNLNQRMDYLEETGGGNNNSSSSDVVETTNIFDRVLLKYDFTVSTSCYTPIVYFYCNPTQILKISARIYGRTLSEPTSTPSMTLKVNEKTIRSELVEKINGYYEYTMSEYYFPGQSFNELIVQTNLNTNYIVTECEIILEGRNIHVLNDERRLTINCFDNKYYVVNKSFSNYFTFGVVERGNLTTKVLNALPNVSSQYITYANSRLNLVPAFQLGTTYVAHEDYPEGLAFPYMAGKNPACPSLARLNADRRPTEYLSWSHTITSLKPLVTGCGNGGLCLLLVNTNGEPKYCGYGGIVANGDLCYNGEQIKGDWLNIMPVRNNNCVMGDTVDTFHGYILSNKNMENYFYPDLDSTYFIELGVGLYPTAYYQPDGTINVYINKNCDVYKFILEKNEEGQYQLSPVKTLMKGISGYEELYDGQALIWKGINFEILEPTI